MVEFEILVEFQGCPEPELPEDTTAARIAIRAGDDCLTRNKPRRPRLSDASDFVIGPAVGIVDWLIENWGPVLWEIHTPFRKDLIATPGSRKSAIPGLNEAFENWSHYIYDGSYSDMSSEEAGVATFADWQHRHQLGHAASNLALPSIVIVPEERHVVVSVDRLPNMMQASVEFLGTTGLDRTASLFVFNKTSFREELKNFIDKTLNQTRSHSEFSGWSEWLVSRWNDAQEKEENYGQRLHWMLGDLGGNRVEDLRSENPRLSDGLRQLLLDCRVVTHDYELNFVEEIVSEFALNADLPGLPKGQDPGWQTVAQESVSSYLPEFAQGYQLARMLRNKLALKASPIVDMAKTFKRLDVIVENSAESQLFRTAVCAADAKRAHIIPSSLDQRMATDVGHRFACAAALGRLLWQYKTSNGPLVCGAQGDHAMLSHTRRANAFAAEFLLPRESVEGVDYRDAKAMGRLSERYSISQGAAEWHAYNVAKDPDEYWA